MTGGLLKGIAVGLVHTMMVAGLGAKFLVDRATRPRVWARAAPVDPDLPIRGRYVRLRLEAGIDPGLTLPADSTDRTATSMERSRRVMLSERGRQLVASAAPQEMGLFAHSIDRDGHQVAVLDRPVAFFIPEHVADPSRLGPGEELWVEVTVPETGLPRPIRLGVKKGGVLVPLALE